MGGGGGALRHRGTEGYRDRKETERNRGVRERERERVLSAAAL